MAENLWGELPLKQNLPQSPKSILQEQAEQITYLTDGRLKGGVTVAIVPGKPPFFVRELSVVAPDLDEYRVGIVNVHHTAEMYPAELIDLVNGGKGSCADEDQFKIALKDILQSQKVRNIVTSLLAQIKEEQVEAERKLVNMF